MLEMPLRRILVGLGDRENRVVPKHTTHNRQVGRISLFVESMWHEDAGLTRQIGDGRVQCRNRVGRVSA